MVVNNLLLRLQQGLTSIYGTLANYATAFEALGGMRGKNAPPSPSEPLKDNLQFDRIAHPRDSQIKFEARLRTPPHSLFKANASISIRRAKGCISFETGS